MYFTASTNWAYNDSNISCPVSLDNVIDLVDGIYRAPEEVVAVRCSGAKTTLKIPWVASVVDLNILIAGNIPQLDSVWGVVSSHESTVCPCGDWRFVSVITGICIL